MSRTVIFVVVEPTSIPMSNCFIYLIFRDSDLSGLHRQKEKGHKPVSYLDLRRFLHDAGDILALDFLKVKEIGAGEVLKTC